MKYGSILAIVAIMGCAACAPQHGGGDVSDTSLQQLSPDGALARFIGEGMEGESAAFDNTRLGSSATVTVGRTYTSALGEICKQASTVRGGVRVALAACQGENGAWELAPDIFDNGAL